MEYWEMKKRPRASTEGSLGTAALRPVIRMGAESEASLRIVAWG